MRFKTFLPFLLFLSWMVGVGSAQDSATAKKASPQKLRVLTFNVLVGFQNDEQRHDLAVEWIAEQKPDVVALQELNNYTVEKLQQDALAWGHPHVQLCQVKSGFHLGLTSREPIEDAHLVTEPGLWHGMIHGRTFGIDFFVLHLAPRPEEIRMPETDIVLRQVREYTAVGRPSILLGDFNSPSRLDKESYERDFKSETTYNVMDRYADGGWVDVCHQHQGGLKEDLASFPSQLIENKWGHTRIDYILASNELTEKCTSASVMKNTATHKLSDHYPVMADFELPK